MRKMVAAARKAGRNKNGFTLAETLLAVLILLMVSGIVATGIPVARNAYEKVVLAANAQLLLSTTVAELRDEIGTAWDVEVNEEGQVSYFSATTGAKTTLSLKKEGNPPGIWIQDYASSVQDKDKAESTAYGTERPLVTDAASAKNLYAAYSSVTITGNVIQFQGLKVYRRSNNHVLAVYGEEGAGASNTLTIRFMKAG